VGGGLAASSAGFFFSGGCALGICCHIDVFKAGTSPFFGLTDAGPARTVSTFFPSPGCTFWFRRLSCFALGHCLFAESPLFCGRYRVAFCVFLVRRVGSVSLRSSFSFDFLLPPSSRRELSSHHRCWSTLFLTC